MRTRRFANHIQLQTLTARNGTLEMPDESRKILIQRFRKRQHRMMVRADLARYRLTLPDDVALPLRITARLRYRKFRPRFVAWVFGSGRSFFSG